MWPDRIEWKKGHNRICGTKEKSDGNYSTENILNNKLVFVTDPVTKIHIFKFDNGNFMIETYKMSADLVELLKIEEIDTIS